MTHNMTRSALVVITDGSEEMEAVIAIDVLRRAGISVTVAALSAAGAAAEGRTVTCSRNVLIRADALLTESIGEFDIIILPGGLTGANRFAESPLVGQLLKKQDAADKLIAAICAAPIALMSHGIGSGKRVTSHPLVADQMKRGPHHFSEDRVVVDGNLITSRSPGTAFEWALVIVRNMLGEEKRKELAVSLLLK